MKKKEKLCIWCGRPSKEVGKLMPIFKFNADIVIISRKVYLCKICKFKGKQYLSNSGTPKIKELLKNCPKRFLELYSIEVTLENEGSITSELFLERLDEKKIKYKINPKFREKSSCLKYYYEM